MAGPLDGTRIVEACSMITGPLASMILADQGAEVIKVEPPGLGDVMRHLTTSREGISALFANCNRGKRSVAIDIRTERGRELLEALVAESQVFIQNYRPGVVERLGLDEPSLRRLRPDLVYVSISAFGPKGPWAHRPAYDHVIQATAGWAAVQGDPESGRPGFVKSAIMDKVTAYTAAQAITAALLARERSGVGQHLQLSMLDAGIAFLWPDGMANHTYLEPDTVLQAAVSDYYRMVETSDGFLAVAAATDAQFHGLFRAFDRPELGEDPRFASYAGRAQHFHELMAAIGLSHPELTSAELHARLEAEDVPCAPVLALEEIPEQSQVQENGILEVREHPRAGRMRQPRPPVRFAATPIGSQGFAPALGGDTEAVLAGLGLDAGEIARLREAGVVA